MSRRRDDRKPIRISFTIDPALANVVTVAASAVGETVSDVVRESVTHYLTLDPEETGQRLRAWTATTTPREPLSWSRTIPFTTGAQTGPSGDRHDDEPVRTRLSFAASRELHQSLLDRATEERRSLSSCCRNAVKRYMRDMYGTDISTTTTQLPAVR